MLQEKAPVMAASSPTATALAAIAWFCCACRTRDSTIYIRRSTMNPRCSSCLKPADFCCSCFCCQPCKRGCCAKCDLRRSVCCAGTWQLIFGGMLGSGYAAITALSFRFEPSFVDPDAAFYALLIHLLVFWWLYFLTGIVGCCTSLDRQGIITYDPRVLVMSRVYLGLNLLCAVCHIPLALLNRGLWSILLTRINIFMTFLPLVWDWYIVYLAWSLIHKLKEQRKGIFHGRPVMHTQRKPGELLELHTGHNLELSPQHHHNHLQGVVPLVLTPAGGGAAVGTSSYRTTQRARWSAPSGDATAYTAAFADGHPVLQAPPTNLTMSRHTQSAIIPRVTIGGVDGAGGDGGGPAGAWQGDYSDGSCVWNLTDSSYSGGRGDGAAAAASSGRWGVARQRQVRDSDSDDGDYWDADEYDGDGEDPRDVAGPYPSGRGGELQQGRRSPQLPMPPAVAAAGSMTAPSGGPAVRGGGGSAAAPAALEGADALAAIQEEDAAHVRRGGAGGGQLGILGQLRLQRFWHLQEEGPAEPAPVVGRARRSAPGGAGQVPPEDDRESPGMVTPGAPPSTGRRTAEESAHADAASERSAVTNRGRTASAAAAADAAVQENAPAAVFELRKLSTRPSFGATLVSPTGGGGTSVSDGSGLWRAQTGKLSRGPSGGRSGLAGARPRNPPLPTLDPVVLSIPVAATYGEALFNRAPSRGAGAGGRDGVEQQQHEGGGGRGQAPTAASGTPAPVLVKPPTLSRRALFLQQMLLQRTKAAPGRDTTAGPGPKSPLSVPDHGRANPHHGREPPASADAHLANRHVSSAGRGGAAAAAGGGGARAVPTRHGVAVRMADPDLEADVEQPPLPRAAARPHAAATAAAGVQPLAAESALAAVPGAAATGFVLQPRSVAASAAPSSAHLSSLGTAAAADADALEGTPLQAQLNGRSSPQGPALAAARLAADSTLTPQPRTPGLLPLPQLPPTPQPPLKVSSWNGRHHRSDDGLLPPRPSAPNPSNPAGQPHPLPPTLRYGNVQRQSVQVQQNPAPMQSPWPHPSPPVQHHPHQQHQQLVQHRGHGVLQRGRDYPTAHSVRGSSGGGSDSGARSDGVGGVGAGASDSGGVSDGGASNGTAGGGLDAAGGRGRGRTPHTTLVTSSSARSLRALRAGFASPPVGSAVAAAAAAAPPSPPLQAGRAVLVAAPADLVDEWMPDQEAGMEAARGSGPLRTVFQMQARTPPPPPPPPPPQKPHRTAEPPTPARVHPRAQSYSEPSYKPAARGRPASAALTQLFTLAEVLQGGLRSQGQPTQLRLHQPRQHLPAAVAPEESVPSGTSNPSLSVWAQEAEGSAAAAAAAHESRGGDGGGGGARGIGVPWNQAKRDLPSPLISSPPAHGQATAAPPPPQQQQQQHHQPQQQRYQHHQHLRQQRQQLLAARRSSRAAPSTRFWRQQRQQQGAAGMREGAAPGDRGSSGGAAGEDGAALMGAATAPVALERAGDLAARAGASAAALWGIISGDWRTQKWCDNSEFDTAGPSSPAGEMVALAAGGGGRDRYAGGAAGGGARAGGGSLGHASQQVMTHGSQLLSEGGARLGFMASSLLSPLGLPAAVKAAREGAIALYDRFAPSTTVPNISRAERGASTVTSRGSSSSSSSPADDWALSVRAWWWRQQEPS